MHGRAQVLQLFLQLERSQPRQLFLVAAGALTDATLLDGHELAVLEDVILQHLGAKSEQGLGHIILVGSVDVAGASPLILLEQDAQVSLESLLFKLQQAR